MKHVPDERMLHHYVHTNCKPQNCHVGKTVKRPPKAEEKKPPEIKKQKP